MCETCGCGDPEIVPVELQESLLAENDHVAAHNRDHFRRLGLTAINLMGSPGSGKTALLEATAARFGRKTGGRPRIYAVSGDLATDRDASRLGAAGIEARSITTGSACHLDARLVHRELHDWQIHHGELHDGELRDGQLGGLSDPQKGLFFIENVGNLVCPAIYDLGQEANVVALAVTEGEDKPLKYPVMFRRADLVVVTKVDLLPHLPGFDLAALESALAQVMPQPRSIRTSAATGEGLDEWLEWLAAEAAAPRGARGTPLGRSRAAWPVHPNGRGGLGAARGE
jgi:hydrogenase nickel incorporation protein HypB